jgi:hypothetical protein
MYHQKVNKHNSCGTVHLNPLAITEIFCDQKILLYQHIKIKKYVKNTYAMLL